MLAVPREFLPLAALDTEREADIVTRRNFKGAPPKNDTTLDGFRPFYGGTCYSDATVGRVLSVTQYNERSVVGSSQWTVTATSAQVYARPIDGYAVREATVTRTVEVS